MSIINSQPLIGASGNQSTAYNLTRSLRFRSSASAYLNRSPASSSNRKTWTFSTWVKRGTLSSDMLLLSVGSSDSARTLVYLDSANTVSFLNNAAGAGYVGAKTNAVLRDPSAWYHIIYSIDTTQATAANRVKLYINGVQQTTNTVNIPQNEDTYINTGGAHYIGRSAAGQSSTDYFDGYMAETNFIDGQALTPSDFGETDTATGVWKPKKYTGTYGTNGFYLKFDNLTSTSTLGNDSSGNSNTWTVNNISLTSGSTYDSMTDVPTLTSATAANYCVLNSLNKGSIITLDSGNLNATSSSGTYGTVLGTIGSASGKYYWEVLINSSDVANAVGIGNSTTDISTYLGKGNSLCYANTGIIYGPNDTTTQSGLATFTTNDIIGVTLNLDASEVKFYKNNTLVTTVTSLSATTWFPAISDFSSVTNLNVSVNFGQRPFAYTPPSGFVALNTFNLPTPTIGATASSQANKYMDATLYTGTTAYPQAITNAASFKPDFVWAKSRSNAQYNGLFDSVRSGYALYSNATDAEDTTEQLTFNSNGFSTPNKAADFINTNGYTYVAWQWRASNATAVTNTAGSITSTVSANTTAGFSIVTYTGTGGARTVGHGLGVTPSMVIVKARGAATNSNWRTYHSGLTSSSYNVLLNTTDAQFAISGATGGGVGTPNSTTFSLIVGSSTADNVNQSGITYVAYCWSEIAGFSKFGSYTGNGSTDGPFLYMGFRPKFYMYKRTDSTSNWVIMDTSRNPYDPAGKWLYPNLSNAENDVVSTDQWDFLSNGLKVRSNGSATNASGGTYIYMAFAEFPQKFSLAR